MSFRIGVDIGGTFTDFTIIDDQGAVTLWKEDTDVRRPTRAVERGLQAAAAQLGLSMAELIGDTTLFVHGTTIATNALIQRSGPRVGLVCTEGFRDVLYLRDGFKPDRFNVHMEHPGTLVDRHLRVPVTERMTRDGTARTPLDESSVRAAARVLAEAQVEAVAVALLWSVVNPAHEQRVAEILAEELPGVPVLNSSDVLPEIREWERTSATVLSAYILPGISSYLGELEDLLRGSGYARGPLIMQINGGCGSVRDILRRPVNVLASGPAAAPAAAAFHSRRQGLDNIITIDMGGTSLDVCVVREGRPAMSRDIQVEHQPIGVPGVEVHSIGAGGGSIAWIDSGGALRVGPRSAGAHPGPAAYGAGGEEPTVTDANVVLGYLVPGAFLGGRRSLRGDLAEQAVADKIATPLGLSTLDAAAGIIRIVNANMVSAIRAVSVERGIDVRRFSLVAGGGAGGLHAVQLARELQISRVLIPREAGTFCAFGMTVTDVRHDETTAHHILSSAEGFEPIDRMFEELESSARARLRADGFADDAMTFERAVDARYPGQVHELTVPVPSVRTLSAEDVRRIEASFHAEHKQQFTYSRPELPVEFLHWRVTAVGRTAETPSASPGDSGEAGDALVDERDAYSPETGGMRTFEVYDADRLRPGAEITGPAIVQAATTTIVVGAGDVLTVQPDLAFSIAVAVQAGAPSLLA